MEVRVRAEWDTLRTVVVHSPGMEMFFGLLEPYASLYDRAFSQDGAVIEHKHLEEILTHEFGVNVVHLKETITSAADRDPAIRERLVDIARDSIRFTGDRNESALALREFEKNASAHDSGFFFDLLLVSPSINVEAGQGAREISLAITERQPLSNLYFMRDSQVVTKNGVVMSGMAKPQRAREPAITRLLWEITDTPVIAGIGGTGTFEGGDFIPMGEFALIGTGDRTNREGVRQFFGSLPGFDEIGVVSQPAHPLIPGDMPDPMVSMHLDTWFNVASPGIVIGPELLMRRARLEVFCREGDTYRKTGETTDLAAYIRGKGFDIIDITTLEQMAYAPNFLCVREGTIIAVEVDRIAKDVIKTLAAKAEMEPERYSRLYAQAQKDYQSLKLEGQFFPHKKEVYRHDIDAYPVSLRNLTGGYGAAHCLTCAVRRG
jgi:arginine deiminase